MPNRLRLTCPKQPNQEYGLPAASITVGYPPPHHRRQELRRGEAALHYSRLACDDRIWQALIERLELVEHVGREGRLNQGLAQPRRRQDSQLPLVRKTHPRDHVRLPLLASCDGGGCRALCRGGEAEKATAMRSLVCRADRRILLGSSVFPGRLVSLVHRVEGLVVAVARSVVIGRLGSAVFTGRHHAGRAGSCCPKPGLKAAAPIDKVKERRSTDGVGRPNSWRPQRQQARETAQIEMSAVPGQARLF